MTTQAPIKIIPRKWFRCNFSLKNKKKAIAVKNGVSE
jgi:hypothetical protein